MGCTLISLFLIFVPSTTYHHIQPLVPDIVEFLYPLSTSGPSLNSLAHPSSLLKKKRLNDMFRVLNHIIYDMFQCMSHVSEIDETRAHFMHDIVSDLLVDASRLMFNLIIEVSLDSSF